MASGEGTARSAFWAVFGQSSGQILSLLFFLVIARFVSQESFGLVAVSLTTVEFVRRIFIDPVTFAVTAKTDITERDYNVCLTILITVGVVGALTLFLLAGPLMAIVGTAEAAPTLRSVAIILLAYGLTGTHGAWLARNMRFRALASRTILAVLAGGAVGITLALNGFELWSLVGQQLTISTINVVALWAASEWRPHLTLRWSDVRETYRRTRHISLSTMWSSIAADADLFFAAAYFGPAAAGVYNAGKRIMLSAYLMLVGAISIVTLSTFANIDEDHRRLREYLNGLMFSSAVTAPAFGGLAMVTPEVVHVVLGEKWAGVAPILTALAFSGYMLSLSLVSSSVLLVAQRSHLDSLSSAAAAALNIATFVVVVHYGPVALAVTVSITSALIVPMRIRFALRELDGHWRDVGAALLPSVVATLGMVLALAIVRWLLPAMPSAARLVLMIAAGFLVYAAQLRLFAPTLFREGLHVLGMRRSGMQPVPAADRAGS